MGLLSLDMGFISLDMGFISLDMDLFRLLWIYLAWYGFISLVMD